MATKEEACITIAITGPQRATHRAGMRPAIIRIAPTTPESLYTTLSHIRSRPTPTRALTAQGSAGKCFPAQIRTPYIGLAM